MRDKVKIAFRAHRDDAKRRGIAFEFTFDGWCDWWWRNLGDDWKAKRGHFRGQFVMARFGDKGAYREDNVKCIPCEVNQSEMSQNGSIAHGEDHYLAKLTIEQVREARALYVPRKRGYSGRALAKKFGVCVATMAECLRGETWRDEGGTCHLR